MGGEDKVSVEDKNQEDFAHPLGEPNSSKELSSELDTSGASQESKSESHEDLFQGDSEEEDKNTSNESGPENDKEGALDKSHSQLETPHKQDISGDSEESGNSSKEGMRRSQEDV